MINKKTLVLTAASLLFSSFCFASGGGSKEPKVKKMVALVIGSWLEASLKAKQTLAQMALERTPNNLSRSNTVAHFAAKKNCPEALDLLTEAGANLELRNSEDKTANDILVSNNKTAANLGIKNGMVLHLAPQLPKELLPHRPGGIPKPPKIRLRGKVSLRQQSNLPSYKSS